MIDLCTLRTPVAALALLALPLGIGLAEETTKPFSGTYRLGSSGCKAGPSQACRLNVEISGELAKAIYESMRSKAVKDECTGGQLKTDRGALTCYVTPEGKHECHFGYDFARKKLVYSDVVC